MSPIGSLKQRHDIVTKNSLPGIQIWNNHLYVYRYWLNRMTPMTRTIHLSFLQIGFGFKTAFSEGTQQQQGSKEWTDWKRDRGSSPFTKALSPNKTPFPTTWIPKTGSSWSLMWDFGLSWVLPIEGATSPSRSLSVSSSPQQSSMADTDTVRSVQVFSLRRSMALYSQEMAQGTRPSFGRLSPLPTMLDQEPESSTSISVLIGSCIKHLTDIIQTSTQKNSTNTRYSACTRSSKHFQIFLWTGATLCLHMHFCPTLVLNDGPGSLSLVKFKL